MFLSRQLLDDPNRHPAPSSEHLGFLCLRAIMRDPKFSPKVKAQASVLGSLLDPQHLHSGEPYDVRCELLESVQPQFAK